MDIDGANPIGLTNALPEDQLPCWEPRNGTTKTMHKKIALSDL